MGKLFYLCCFITLTNVFGAKFPSDLPKCKAGDTECLQNIITQIVQQVSDGHPGLSLSSIDPLHINAIDIIQGEESPINIELKFKDVDLTGLKYAKVTRVVGFGKDPRKSKYEVDAVLPGIKIDGNYKINGRVLVLPIQGNGKSNLTFENVDIHIKFTPKVTMKNGKTYIQTDTFKLFFDTKKFSLYLTNLFNGDKALGDNMNLFINENWRDILKELKPSIQDTISQILQNIINRIFAKISYDDIFLD